MSEPTKVAFIGLGVMGFPMAGHLAAAGHAVTVYNRTQEKAQSWVGKHGGTAAKTPAQAAKGQGIVFACVGNDDDVRSIAYGEDGAFAGMSESAIFVDHTTDSANLARELDAAAKGRGLGFLDAPVSGGQAGAENGALTIMVGGDEATFATASPVMDAYARAVRSAWGHGQRPAHEDGQSDLHRRPGPGACRGHPLRNKGRTRHRYRGLRRSQKGRPVPGRWRIAPPRWPPMSFEFGFAVNWMRRP